MPNRKWKNRNANWKNASSETPVTISGVAKERYRDPEIQADARFHSAYAARVPQMVARIVAPMPMIRLFAAESINSRSWKIAEYQRREKSCQMVNFDSLKLKIARIKRGTCRNA